MECLVLLCKVPLPHLTSTLLHLRIVDICNLKNSLPCLSPDCPVNVFKSFKTFGTHVKHCPWVMEIFSAYDNALQMLMLNSSMIS